MAHLCLGVACYLARQYDRAVEKYQHALELDPHFGPAYLYIGIALLIKGSFEEAAKAILDSVRLMGRRPLCLGMLGLAYGRAGRVAEAQKILAELRDLAQRAYVSPSTFVLIHLGLGELYKALDWTEKAIDECDSIMFLLPFNPIFDSLRSHPRYKVLLRKMNLEP